MKWAHSSTKGFTIVEILVVIVVIGILATIGFVTYNGIQDRARLAVAKTHLDALGKATDLYRTTKWVNPTSDAEIKQIFIEAGLYDAVKNPDELSFGICTSQNGYAFVAWEPVVDGIKNGDTLYLYSQDNGQQTHTLTNSSLVSGHVDKLCDQVLPSATYERWSYDIAW